MLNDFTLFVSFMRITIHDTNFWPAMKRSDVIQSKNRMHGQIFIYTCSYSYFGNQLNFIS